MGFHYHKTSCLDPILNKINTFLHNTTLAIGFSFTSWRKITDLQILYKIGIFHVDKMRCIQLMNTEFSMMNKDLRRRALTHAEKANSVAPDQYRFYKKIKIKKIKSNQCVFNKVLINDLLWQKLHCGAIAINDLTIFLFYSSCSCNSGSAKLWYVVNSNQSTF